MNGLAQALLKTGKNREKQNIIWNMTGSFCYALASMVLSFLVLGIVGDEEGGMFSFGFSTFGQQMFILAYFGIRPYQVTDGTGEYSFGDYLHHRMLTCLAAALFGAGYLAVSDYSFQKSLVVFLLVCYKVIDGFADVYESEFQRNGRLYLTGKSNTFRTLLSVGSFLGTLVATRHLALSCLVAVAAQAAGVVLFDWMVIRELEAVDWTWKRQHIMPLFQGTYLLFVSVFLDFYVFSAVKYAIDANMNDVASGHFNIIFMPTSVINLAAGFVIRPFLTYLTEYWNEGRFREFTGMLKKISLIIGGLTVLAVSAAWLLGRPALGLLERILGDAYAGKLTVYQDAFVWIVLGGGFYALLNLFYYVLVILRKQKVIFGIYLVMSLAAAFTAPAMVRAYGIPGAARGYLFLMIWMAAMFLAGAWRCGKKGMAIWKK